MTQGLPEWLVALIAVVYPAIDGGQPDAYNGYLEADYVYISPAGAGRISSISVDEGDRIFAGQQVFTLDASQQKSQLRAAVARVEVARANLSNLQTGSRDQEVEVIRAELAKAEAERDLASGTLSRSEALLARASASRAQVDADRASLARAKAQVAELEARLQVAELPARDAQLIAAKATLQAAEAEAEAARTALDDRTILAPAQGRVEKRFFEEGEVAAAGVPVLSVLPDNHLRVIFFVPEPARAGLSVGDSLGISCDGCPDGLAARLVRLASSPQYTPPIIYSREERSRLVFRAEARIDDATGLLPGQPVTLAILP